MKALHVPGLREMSLRIEIGDVVQLRQLRFGPYGRVLLEPPVKTQRGNRMTPLDYLHRQYDSVVWGIDRLQETLALRIDGLVPQSMLFNVGFTVQLGRIGACHRAAVAAQRILDDPVNTWMRSMLFPGPTDGYYQKTLNKGKLELDLRDPLLNYEQRKAVNTVLNDLYGPVPYIISGPPGTGKTKTMVELAL